MDNKNNSNAKKDAAGLNSKTVACLAMAAIMLVSAIGAMAFLPGVDSSSGAVTSTNGETGGSIDAIDWYYDSDAGVLTIYGDGPMPSFTSVTETPWYQYINSPYRTKLVITEGVTAIGAMSFSNGDGLVGNLTIPSSVGQIGSYAFAGCRSLDSLTFATSEDNNLTIINLGAFLSCAGMRGDLVIPDGVTSIVKEAFANCGFDGTLTLPDSVKSIGDAAFAACNGLKGHYVIPSGTNLAAGTFAGTLVTLDATHRSGYYTLYDGRMLFNDSEIKSVSNGCPFYIPEMMTKIADHAFRGCTELKGQIVIPRNVTMIGYAAFTGCTGLTGIIFEDNPIIKLSKYCFVDCPSLTKVVFNCQEVDIQSTTEPSFDFDFYDKDGNKVPESGLAGNSYVYHLGGMVCNTPDDSSTNMWLYTFVGVLVAFSALVGVFYFVKRR